MLHLFGKQLGSSSKQLKTELPYDPEIPLLGIYPKELKAETETDTWMPLFTAALFKIAKDRKNPNVHQWINIQYIHTMEYYSVTKRYEVLIHTAT